MATNTRFKKSIPHLIIIGIFIVIACIYCYPQLKGESVLPPDIFNWLAMSKEARDYYTSTGQNAFWSNSMFSGMPLSMTYVKTSGNWYGELNNIVNGIKIDKPINPLMLFLVAMISFYVLMRSLRINKWIGAVCAVGFAFSSYLPIIIAAGHGTKMMDISLMPGVLAGIIYMYRGRYGLGIVVTAIFLAFFLASGHYQIIYYSLFVIALLVIATFIGMLKQKKTKQFLIGSLLLLVIVGFASLTMYSALSIVSEYNKFSMRGGTSELAANKDKKGGLDKDYANSWSNGIGETFCIMVPNLYGGSSSENIGEDSHFGETLSELGAQQDMIERATSAAPTYWGPQPFLSGPIYFGAVICFLFVLSLFTIKSKHKWWVIGVCFFFIMLSWGSHFKAFNDIVFDLIPMYNKFRTPSMALSVPLVLFPAMGAWGLYELLKGEYTSQEAVKKVKYALFITGGLCVLLLLCCFMFFDFKGVNDEPMAQQYGKEVGDKIVRALRADRSSIAIKDIFRSLVFIALAAAALWAFAKNKIKATYALGAIALLIAIDEFPVAKRYLNKDAYLDEDAYTQAFAPSGVDAQILNDKDPYYRVFDLSKGLGNTFNDVRPALFHKLIGGYHPAKMEIYQDLIANQISKLNIPVLNMLNTKYIITPADKQRPEMAQPNPAALGNAWFVSDIKWAATADDEMNALNGPALNNPMDTTVGNFQPQHTVVIREKYRKELGNYVFGKDSTAVIKLTKYSPRDLEYQSNNTQNGFAVFSDIYYPLGWKATVDGKEATIYNVNYVLRGLQIPAGKHYIKFSFMLEGFEKGERFSLYGSIGLTVIILAGLFLIFRYKKNDDDDYSDLLADKLEIDAPHNLKSSDKNN